MSITSLDHVQVAAAPGCEQTARDFPGGSLGMIEIPTPPDLLGRAGVWSRSGERDSLGHRATPRAPLARRA